MKRCPTNTAIEGNNSTQVQDVLLIEEHDNSGFLSISVSSETERALLLVYPSGSHNPNLG